MLFNIAKNSVVYDIIIGFLFNKCILLLFIHGYRFKRDYKILDNFFFVFSLSQHNTDYIIIFFIRTLHTQNIVFIPL